MGIIHIGFGIFAVCVAAAHNFIIYISVGDGDVSITGYAGVRVGFGGLTAAKEVADAAALHGKVG
ncbi:hypothetical protein SDC9_137713 [bioreactor metagenome]|uniref:Uncharacterized protein n=1 Tax=bioreactor metagenome TaxID=1076179 RepID=A0A645DQ34_9ZZZZ